MKEVTFLSRYIKLLRTGGQNSCQKIAANGPTVTPKSALAAEVEAVGVEDMEVGLDYWLPGDVELQQMRLQATRESFDPLSVLPWFLLYHLYVHRCVKIIQLS